MSTPENSTLLQINMPQRSLERFRAMQQMADATETEVAKGAFRLYEEALKKTIESEAAGGQVYLTVKYPDGRVDEQLIFTMETDA